MKLHEFPEEYNELVSLVAREKYISEYYYLVTV